MRNTNKGSIQDFELSGVDDFLSPSEVYHENSKITKSKSRFVLDAELLAVASAGYKSYRYADRIPLPAGIDIAGVPVADAIRRRRSVRHYTGAAMSLEDLSTLLALSYSETGGVRQRPVPSAGALFPLEVYVAAFAVSDLASGLYHYDVRNHELESVDRNVERKHFSESIFADGVVAGASALILLSSMFGRSKIKYRERAYRFCLLEAGHLAQNLGLICTAAGLGSCMIGGFVDDAVNGVLGLDGVDEAVVYIASVGQTR